MKKKFLALVLALCMALALLPGAAFAANSEFVIDKGVLTKYNGTGGAVTIPSGVTEIGQAAFQDCTGLTSVTIPSGVTKIGMDAFYRCTNLTSVTIPDSVTEIVFDAFANCTSLTSVTIPNSVTQIGWFAFAYCTSLTSVTIPNSVTEIGNSVFSGCTSLTSVTIPSSVTAIGDSAFADCTSLTNLTIPSSVTAIGNSTFSNCTSLTSITIPDSVTALSEHAFANCTGLTSVTIPGSITEIDRWAFRACTGLTSVTISSGVTKVGSGAFSLCNSLTSVTIPASVTEIGEEAFHDYNYETDDRIPLVPLGMTIYGVSGSYAEVYAKENGFPFVSDSGSSTPSTGTGTTTPAVSFSDVKSTAFYAEPVAWAVEKGITNGTSESTFSPDATCTQAQILTFLWRAQGEPAPKEPVGGTQFYAPAAQWADDLELIDLLSTFSANADCTRAMVVTYLWKLAGSPNVGSSNFTDVPANADYAQAVAWAVQQGITNGISDTSFAPDATCTRGQIVTFLYRAFAD